MYGRDPDDGLFHFFIDQPTKFRIKPVPFFDEILIDRFALCP